MPVMDGLQTTRLIRSCEESGNWDAAKDAGIDEEVSPSNSLQRSDESSTKRIPIIAVRTYTLNALIACALQPLYFHIISCLLHFSLCCLCLYNIILTIQKNVYKL